jgi:hypothetical protein
VFVARFLSRLARPQEAKAHLLTALRVQPVALWSNFFCHNGWSISARMLEVTMNSTATAGPPACSRLALIVAGIFALLGSFVVTAPAQAGYYDGSYPCSYRCGYPAYRYYPTYRYHNGCYSCGRHLIYERRYVEREFVERRYGYGGYRRPYGYYPYGGYRRPYGYYPYGGYRRSYGCNPCGGYRSWSRPSGYGNGYGYGGIGRRWPAPYVDGYERSGYEEPPRPPAPVGDGDDY